MNRIKQLRKEINITQEELAKKLNLSKGIISLYENGTRKPSLDVAVSMANLFDCSIDYLLGYFDYKNPKTVLENELYKLDLSESELNNVLNIIGGETIQPLSIMFSKKTDKITIACKKCLSIIFHYVPPENEELTDEQRHIVDLEYSKQHKKALACINSLDKSKIIHNYKDKYEQEFHFAYHKEMEGLTDEEIADALRFYKEMKKRIEKDNK